MMMDRAERVGWYAAYALAGLFVAGVLTLSVLRLCYPHEIEWMEGAMMDHAARIVEGKPIYTAPTIDFVAWLYPPLYYVAVAAAMKLVGVIWFAGRIVSVLSTLVTALMLSAITKRITNDKRWAVMTFALYLASYHATGYYFDIVRNDAFFTCTLVLLAYAAFRSRSQVAALLTGVIWVAAFFTKQQAIFFLPVIAIWFWQQDRKQALSFLASACGLATAVYFFLQYQTGGWLSYYLFAIPNAKRADFTWLRAFTVLPEYAFGAFALCSVALAWLILEARASAAFWKSQTGLLAMSASAALIAGALSVGNDGGYKNVMMPFAAFVIPLLPIALSTVSSSNKQVASFAPYLLCFQFLAFSMNPLGEKMLIASAKQRKGGDEFDAKLRSIPGEVFIPYHGFITRAAGKPSHAHVLATIDVLRMNDTTAKRLSRDFADAYASHRFSAIIEEESRAFARDSVRGYTQIGTMVAEPSVNLTRVADDVTRAQYLYIPQKSDQSQKP